ncbi:MAG TPA: hypothetical protein PKJ94_12675 [Ferruginibacter sp.]|nr:hypothetical protein [Ferruginibacter sp.]
MRYITLAIGVFHIFSSCVDKSNNALTVFRATDEGLQQSVKTIAITNKIIYRALEDRLTDPDAKVIAGNWYPKAIVVKSLSDSVVKYIAGLKEELKNEAGTNDQGDKLSYKEDNSNAVNHLFNDHEKGKELFDKLLRYRQEILAIDPELTKAIYHTILVFAGGFDYTKTGSAAFTKTFVNDIPAVAALAMLSKFENNIRINENVLVSFCLNKTYPVMIIDDFPMPLVSLSSNTVKPGAEIEITAGIGAFSSSANPKITVDGKSVVVDDGVGIYKLRASMKPGNHFVRVVMTFIKPGGGTMTLEREVRYTVTE